MRSHPWRFAPYHVTPFAAWGKYAANKLPIVYLNRCILQKILSIGDNAMTDMRVATQPSLSSRPVKPDAALREAATQLEAEFLTEMLKHTGLGKPRDSMGGGVGEEQFSSFLVREQATAMANQGGIGLSESLFEALKKGQTHGQ
jgi:Rod binding domain-containing protein